MGPGADESAVRAGVDPVKDNHRPSSPARKNRAVTRVHVVYLLGGTMGPVLLVSLSFRSHRNTKTALAPPR